MNFVSTDFFLLLCLTFATYYVLKNEWQQVICLLISSFTFYAWHEPYLLSLLLISILLNALAFDQLVKSETLRSKRFHLLWGIIANLLLLGSFKYAGFFGSIFLNSDSLSGHWLLSIPLPIGISFYTFQGISLLMDTYRGEETELNASLQTTNRLQRIAIFISFFPQLIAGPIVKAKEFIPQLSFKRLGEVNWEYCLHYLLTGWFLKSFVADNLKDLTFWMSAPHYLRIDSLNLWALLFGYSFQIFADFAGYSAMAMGLAALFGYRLPVNFNYPYISSSVQEFWKRWHISLGTFLKEYLYYPLGGNRKGQFRMYVNLMIVMVLGGLWHGAAWSYVVWGTWHGAALVLERALPPAKSGHSVIRVSKVLLVFLFITFSWLLFRLPLFSDVLGYLDVMLIPDSSATTSFDAIGFLYVVLFSLPVIIMHLLYLLNVPSRSTYIIWFRPLIYATMLILLLTNSGTTGEFIYFQF